MRFSCLTTCCTTSASKVEKIGLWSFVSCSILTWPLSNWLPLLQAPRQLFAGKMLPQSTQGRKWFPRVHQILKHGFLRYSNKLISHGKNMLTVIVPILINKDVFEPSYSDLKFMVWNHNYFSTNLIFTGLHNIHRSAQGMVLTFYFKIKQQSFVECLPRVPKLCSILLHLHCHFLSICTYFFFLKPLCVHFKRNAILPLNISVCKLLRKKILLTELP